MTAQPIRDGLLLDGRSVVVLFELAAAGLPALERIHGYTAGAEVHELLNVLARTATEVRARSTVTARGHPRDTTDPVGSRCNQSTEIGSRAAGSLLGLSARTVVRLAAGLGGRQVSGRWVFTRSAVLAVAAERNQHR